MQYNDRSVLVLSTFALQLDQQGRQRAPQPSQASESTNKRSLFHHQENFQTLGCVTRTKRGRTCNFTNEHQGRNQTQEFYAPRLPTQTLAATQLCGFLFIDTWAFGGRASINDSEHKLAQQLKTESSLSHTHTQSLYVLLLCCFTATMLSQV